MIRLFTLEKLSAFSSDTVYKICLMLDRFGLSDDKVYTFKSYGEMYEAASYALQEGDHVILAADCDNYYTVKRKSIGKLLLEEYSSPEIAEKISACATEPCDMVGECLIPNGALCHLSADGTFSGFTVAALEGLLTVLPLDFAKVDDIINSLISSVLDRKEKPRTIKTEKPQEASQDEPLEEQESENEEEQKEAEQETEAADLPVYYEKTAETVALLAKCKKSLTLAMGEATTGIYELYDKIDGFSQVLSFVEVLDEDDEDEEQDGEDEAEKTIRYAKEAMYNTRSDFGAAISDIYAVQDEDDRTVYFAYVAFADGRNPKAKRITTTNENDLQILLPHCVSVLCETVLSHLEQFVPNDDFDELPPEQSKKPQKGAKKLSKGMIAFACIIFLVAAISPVFILSKIFKQNTPSTTVTPPPSTTAPTQSTSEPAQTQPTTPQFPGITNPTGQAPSAVVPVDASNGLIPAEPTAGNIDAPQTTATKPSKKGRFTFYVFGYGHGVGLSQQGANFLAKQGWNYAQILANYYYGAVLVSNDTYPKTIKYAGTEYKTRDYLASVLESEMGSSFHIEALKAQAVAVYTFAKYYNYSLSTDSNAFGKKPSSQAYAAVDEVMKHGLYIATDNSGATALTPFHAMSAGKTTSFKNAWGGEASMPYLAGGRPSSCDCNAENYRSTYVISSEELKLLAKEKLDVTLNGDPSTWLAILSHDGAINNEIGYVSSIRVGSKVISGNEFRGKLLVGKIRSHCFTVNYEPEA